MILDNIKNLQNYAFLPAKLLRALETIRDTDFSKLEDSRYEVEGEDIFFFIQAYPTRDENLKLEAHRKYIDIQYMICGTECMGVGQLDDMTEEVEANPEKDCWFYYGPMDMLTVKEGMFAVFFPNDIHRPGMAYNKKNVPLKKIVVKVKV